MKLFETKKYILEVDDIRKSHRQFDTITNRIHQSLKKPEIRRRIKWGAVVLLIINLIAWPLSLYYVSKPEETKAAPIAQYSGGLLVYADTATVGTPKYKTFDDTTGFGAEQNAQSVGSNAIAWIRVAASPANDEWIIATRDTANIIKAQVCTGIDGGVSCGTPTQITASGGTHGLRNFDVVYEQQSTGQAILVYGTSTADALRKIEWTGGSWQNDAAITTTRTSGTVEWVEITSRHTSDQIGIAYSDSNDDVSAYRWNGSAVADEATNYIYNAATTADVRKFDVSFEHASGDMFVAVPFGAGNVAYGQLSGTTWTITTSGLPDFTTGFADMPEQAYTSPGDNDLAISTHGTVTASNTTEGYGWNGGAISDGTAADDAAQVFSATTDKWQLSATSFGNSTYYGVGVISSTASGADDIEWWTMNASTAMTDQTVNTRTRGNSRFLDLFDYPNADKVLLVTADANSDMWADSWNGGTGGTAWTDRSGGGALELNLATTATDVVDFAFRLAPPPNSPPTINVDTPASDVDIGETANYTIQYDLDDGDSTATVDFYFETDGNGAGGTAISACQNQAEGTNATCQFTPSTEGMSLSTYYYIYGVASDGVNPDVTDVSAGRIRRNAAPTLSVTDPDGTGDTVTQGQTYTIYFNLADTDSTVTVDLYYDTDGSGLNGTAIAACTNLSEATTSCGWDTTGVSPDTYFIYGRDVNDTVNSEVTDYSPGEVTVQSGNTAPNDPSSLAQKKTDDSVISVGGWINETSVKFTAIAQDTDNPDTLYLCVEKDILGTGFSGTEDLCGSGVAYSGTPVTVTVTISGITDANEYHWQARVKDSASAYSGWKSYPTPTPNGENERDFGIDTTAPTGGTVKDGTGADQDWNNGSLTDISANWTGTEPTSTVSGLQKYEYAIRRQSDGWYWNTGGSWQPGEFWTNAGTSTSFTTNSMNLETGVTYYTSLKTTDNAGNTATISSNGQQVLPTLSFSMDSNLITFTDLNNANSWTDTKTSTFTTSTNARNGYTITAYLNDYLRSLAYPAKYITDFIGTWVSPQSWGGGTYGFGYTSNDTLVQGSNRFSGGTLFARYSHTASGDVVADHTALINGSTGAVTNEQFILTHKVSVSQSQEASKYQTTLFVICTANF